MTDEYSGIFDSLNPDDFNLDTTAVQEISRTNEGVEAFNAFVDEQQRAFRMAWIAADGNVKPIAILASPDKQRVFIPDMEETLGEYVQRLHREAVKMQAIWLYAARKTIVARLGIAGEGVDFGDEELVQEALADGRATVGAEWFAERREGDENHHRFGIMQDTDGRLSDPIQAPTGQSTATWSLILG